MDEKPTEDQSASGSRSEPDEEQSEPAEAAAEQRDPLPVRPRGRPRTSCHQCGRSFTTQRWLSNHLRSHANEPRPEVPSEGPPLPAETAEPSPDEMEKDAGKPVEEEPESDDPLASRIEEEELNGSNEENSFTLRLDESDDEIPEVQAEINSEDEEDVLRKLETGVTLNSLLIGLLDGTSGGATSDPDERGTILGPTPTESSKSVIGQQHNPLTSVPVPVSSEILAVKEVRDKEVEELSAQLPLPELTSANLAATSTNNTSTNIAGISTNTPTLVPVPVYTVTQTTPIGINITLSSIICADTTIATETIDPKTSITSNNIDNFSLPPPILSAKNAFPELFNSPSESAEIPQLLPVNVKTVVLPTVPVSTKSTERVEPEPCPSAIVLESESRVANTTDNNITNNISTSNITRPNHPLPPSAPTSGPPSAPLIVFKNFKYNNNSNNGFRSVLKPNIGGGRAAVSELKIQSVVSLAPQKHLTEDFRSSCVCLACKDLRDGDLLRQCRQPRGPTGDAPRYKCFACGEAYERALLLLRHCSRNGHGFVCEVCDKGYILQSHYNMHKKMHEKMHQASAGGRGVIMGPTRQPQGRADDDDEVRVVGEIVHISAQRTTSTNGSANPAQLDRILNNSEITLTTVTADGSNAGGKVQTTSDTGSGTSAGLRNILPAPSSVAPPTQPTTTTPLSTSDTALVNQLKQLDASLAARQQQQMAAGASLPPRINVYGTILKNKSGPPLPVPTRPVTISVPCQMCPLSFSSVASFQAHFNQIHTLARAPAPQQYNCKHCCRAYTSNMRLRHHQSRCSYKERNVLLCPSQDSPHSEPGSGEPSVDNHNQQPEVISPLPDVEIIEERSVTESPPVDIRPCVTVTPIFPEATPTDARDCSPEAEVTRLRPEASTANSIPEIKEVSVNVVRVAQPEVVDISEDCSRSNNSTARPEVNASVAPPTHSTPTTNTPTSTSGLRKAASPLAARQEQQMVMISLAQYRHFLSVAPRPPMAPPTSGQPYFINGFQSAMTLWYCSLCRLSFLSSDSLTQHCNQIHNGCRHCSRACTSTNQLKDHQSKCKGTVPQPNPLVSPSQDSPHFALTHSEPGSCEPSVDNHNQQPEATPNDARECSPEAEVMRLKPEASMANTIPEIKEASVNVISVAQPEVVDISDDCSRSNNSMARPEVKEPETCMEISVEPEKNPEVVPKPKAYTNLDPEEDIPEAEEAMEVQSAQTLEVDLSVLPSIGEAEDYACVVCDRPFTDYDSLVQHVRTHAIISPEAVSGSPSLTSCSSQKTTCAAKRTLQSPQSSPAKRPRVDEPEVPSSAAIAPPTEARAIEPSGNLAVLVVDMDKFEVNEGLLRNMGAVGLVSLNEVRSSGTLNFIKKF